MERLEGFRQQFQPVEAQHGLEHQAAAVGEQQALGRLELLRLLLLPGDENPLLEGAVQLRF